ncbi:MAG TPA: HAD-IC family P-type ATPase [Gemmatimonadales bacterium]
MSKTGSGLSSAQAAERLRQAGPNALPEEPAEPAWRRFARQFRSPLIYILLFALLLELGIWLVQRGGFPFEAIAIAAILLLNAGLGMWQEWKAENALERLKELGTPQIWTMRDGSITRIPSPELVPGDLIRLESGDRVPADGMVQDGENLLLDESVLTGESFPVEKENGAELFSGTLAVRGHTYVEVTRTGPQSAMGRLAGMLGEVESQATPLERRLEEFGRRIARWVLALAALLAAAGLLIEGIGRMGQVLLFAVALAVAAVPEGLPAVLTFTLALGVERMARRKAVVRRLAAVEALGSVTVIATDKTGTLTENRMVVRGVESPDPPRALRALALANDAEPGSAAGDPLELALYAWARGQGVEPERLQADQPRLSSRSFDAAWKYMRVTVSEHDSEVSYLKGAPEVLLQHCRMVDADREAWNRKLEEYAAEGLRTLALAWGPGESETELTWLGLVLLWDPPRAEVPDAIAQARAAGIRVLMITGDHPATAQTVARVIGLEAGQVLTGPDLEAMSPDRLRTAVREVSVFARMKPEHKLRLVEALRESGDVVAMTGDGVNDAPALKRADVGVAMGRRGSAVSREVADLVLLDDNFATIVAAVEEGRSIYYNVQAFIRFLFSTNLSEVLVVALGLVAAAALGLRESDGGWLLPLTAAQLLWINLVTDGAPALALALDRTPGVMQRPPRAVDAPLLDPSSLRFIVTTGSLKALVALALLGLLPLAGTSLDVTRTTVFLFLAVGQLLFAYPARRTDVTPGPNRLLHFAVLAGVAAQLPILLVPALRAAFDVALGPLPLLPLVALAAVASWLAAEGAGRIVWRRTKAAPGLEKPGSRV